jgi:hypothetical protein
MIEIINPLFLYAQSFIGALGVIWLFKFSNNQNLRKIAPTNKLRQSIALILLTNIFVWVYLIVHAKFISHMLIDPGFIKSSDGSGGGFYWNDSLGNWDQQNLKKYEIDKFIKELVFMSINISLVIIALFLRKKNKSKTHQEITKKPNFGYTIVLIILTLLFTFITFGGILIMIDQYFIWEGG